MLLVRARVGISAISGFGLIAREFVPRGAIVWQFVPGFDLEIPEDALSALSPSAREQVLHYAEYFPDERKFRLSSDDDRFCNHSDNPNLGTCHKKMIALRDIPVGEEMTCDYRECMMVGFCPGPRQ